MPSSIVVVVVVVVVIVTVVHLIQTSKSRSISFNKCIACACNEA